MPYKAYMLFGNEEAKSNDLVFTTEKEAHSYAKDLYSRWMIPTGYETRECNESVNYKWTDFGLVKLN